MALQLKTVNTAHGLRWIIDALRLFVRKPVAFTALFAMFLGAALLVSLVPLLGGLVQMMALPMLSLGFMVAAQSALLAGPVHPRCFLEPLQGDVQRRRALLILCALYGVLAVGILLLANAVSDNAWMRLQDLLAKGSVAQRQVDALMQEPGVQNGVLTAAVLGSLLSVPFWHAPALVHWGGQSWGQALFSSTLALWRNKGAFTAYLLGWLALVLVFAAVTGLLLGLLGMPGAANVLAIPAGLVLSAAFYISLLFCFNDSFGGAKLQSELPADDEHPGSPPPPPHPPPPSQLPPPQP